MLYSWQGNLGHTKNGIPLFRFSCHELSVGEIKWRTFFSRVDNWWNKTVCCKVSGKQSMGERSDPKGRDRGCLVLLPRTAGGTEWEWETELVNILGVWDSFLNPAANLPCGSEITLLGFHSFTWHWRFLPALVFSLRMPYFTFSLQSDILLMIDYSSIFCLPTEADAPCNDTTCHLAQHWPPNT